MATTDISEIRENLDEIIAMKPDNIENTFGDPCTDDEWHSPRCLDRMDIHSEPCIMVQVLTAQDRKERLDKLQDLTNCAKRPFEANGKGILEGLATDSCIYEVE